MRKILTVLMVLFVFGVNAFAFDDFVFVTNNTALDRTIEVTYTYPQSGLHYNDTRYWTITVEPGETLKFETKANLSRNGKYKISMINREKDELYMLQSKWDGEDIVVTLKDYNGEVYTNTSIKEILEEKHMVLETKNHWTKMALKGGFSPVEKYAIVVYKRGLIYIFEEADERSILLYQVFVSMSEEWALQQLK